MTKLEQEDEDEFCEWIGEKEYGVALKLKGIGFDGWPDRQVMLHNGIIFFIEFKTKIGQTSAQQDHWRSVLEGTLGFKYHVCRSSIEAKRLVKKYMR